MDIIYFNGLNRNPLFNFWRVCVLVFAVEFLLSWKGHLIMVGTILMGFFSL